MYDREYSGEVKFTKQIFDGFVSKHPLYTTWYMMNVRCSDDRHKAFHRYGGRGIFVDLSWRWDNPYGFSNFVKCVGERPEGKTLDRQDNDGGYTPENCTWSSRRYQQNNTSLGKSNTSGEMGVCWDSSSNAWLVQINLNGGTKSLRHFNKEDFEVAKEYYKEIKNIKMKFGDDESLKYHLSKVELTPAGKKKHRNKTSRFYGVASKRDKWRAYINVKEGGKFRQVSLGVYEKEEDAYEAVLSRLKKVGGIIEEDI